MGNSMSLWVVIQSNRFLTGGLSANGVSAFCIIHRLFILVSKYYEQSVTGGDFRCQGSDAPWPEAQCDKSIFNTTLGGN